MTESTCFHITPRQQSNAPSLPLEEPQLFDRVIAPVCSKHGIRAIHGSHLPLSGEIAEIAIGRIREALLVTGEVSASSPDVEYEVGATLALEKPFVWFLSKQFMASPIDAVRKSEFVHYSLESELEVDLARKALEERLLGFVASKDTIPASDRHVSTADNSEPFAMLVAKLNRVRAEFADDHKSNELGGEEGKILLSEIDATLAQISNGIVRTKQLTQGLKPALERSLLAYPGLRTLIDDALNVLGTLLKAIGI